MTARKPVPPPSHERLDCRTCTHVDLFKLRCHSLVPCVNGHMFAPTVTPMMLWKTRSGSLYSETCTGDPILAPLRTTTPDEHMG
jgi:hypothetical protein